MQLWHRVADVDEHVAQGKTQFSLHVSKAVNEYPLIQAEQTPVFEQVKQLSVHIKQSFPLR